MYAWPNRPALSVALLCLAVPSFVGCRRGEPERVAAGMAYAAPTPAPAGAVTADQFARARGLVRVAAEPGRERFRGVGMDVEFVPGRAAARVNGRDVPLAFAPCRSPAGLLVPPSLPVAVRPAPGARVVLDAGHGGSDPGAVAHGVREKDVTLAVACEVAALLRARGVEVVMTRDADRDLSLPQRSAVANGHPGAVFVSIHANAAPRANPQAAGIETFVLSSKVSDLARANRAAARYPAAVVAGAPDAYARLASDVRTDGQRLAGEVQRALSAWTGDVDRGVKSADFHVLRETYFGPAVLTEIGFLTHPETARRLADPGYRSQVASAVADGVVRYLCAGR